MIEPRAASSIRYQLRNRAVLDHNKSSVNTGSEAPSREGKITELRGAVSKVTNKFSVRTHRNRVVRTITCEACLDEIYPNQGLRAKCGHFYCKSCLSDRFLLAVEDIDYFPARCCDELISLGTATKRLLSKNVVSRYLEKDAELKDHHPKYCSSTTCTAYLPRRCRNGDVATCSKCKTRTCMLCESSAHEGDCTDVAALQQVFAMAKARMWQRCSACKHMVERVSGCPWMR